jgi:hypothetical protein
METSDAIGRWREKDVDANAPIDARTVLPTGRAIEGPVQLREALFGSRTFRVRAFTEKLMMYALGRAESEYDMPQVRRRARDARRRRTTGCRRLCRASCRGCVSGCRGRSNTKRTWRHHGRIGSRQEQTGSRGTSCLDPISAVRVALRRPSDRMCLRNSAIRCLFSAIFAISALNVVAVFEDKTCS